MSQQHIAIMESPLPRSSRFIPMIPRSEAYVPADELASKRIINSRTDRLTHFRLQRLGPRRT
jgi:hypothetical protein